MDGPAPSIIHEDPSLSLAAAHVDRPGSANGSAEPNAAVLVVPLLSTGLPLFNCAHPPVLEAKESLGTNQEEADGAQIGGAAPDSGGSPVIAAASPSGAHPSLRGRRRPAPLTKAPLVLRLQWTRSSRPS